MNSLKLPELGAVRISNGNGLFLCTSTMAYHQSNPNHFLKRFWLRNNQEGQWKYIVEKAAKAFKSLCALHNIGDEGTMRFHDKVDLIVRQSESDSAVERARIVCNLESVYEPYMVRFMDVLEQARKDLLRANGRPIGTRSILKTAPIALTSQVDDKALTPSP